MSSLYHTATNGLTERSVQSFKQGMKRTESGSLHCKLFRFCSVTSLSIYNRVIVMVRIFIEGYIGSVRTLCPISK